MFKRKIIFMTVSLVLCLAFLVYASYAWLTMSIAPEIQGVDTHIGANGSLEIALLSNETYVDPSLIRTGIGDSMGIQQATVSNLTWGNIVDLSHEDYGLAKAVLLPARLNVTPGGTGSGVVGSNMLIVGGYEADGRIDYFDSNTVTATYHDAKFTYYAANQDYGVRAIGSVSNVTSQQAALANARTSVRSYATSAKRAGESVWSANGLTLLDIYFKRYHDGSERFTKADVAAIRDTATRMTSLLSYIDSALRQGIVGYAASVIEDESQFKTVRSTVENTVVPLSLILDQVAVSLPSNFPAWVKTVEDGKAVMRYIVTGCDSLTGDTFTWEQIYPILSPLLVAESVYLNDYKFTDPEAFGNITIDNELTLPGNAGWLATVADFAGDLDTFFTLAEKESVHVTTLSTVETPYLIQIAETLDGREAINGGSSSSTADLEDIYGFAVDLAVRCNSDTDLLLQTPAADRVDPDGDDLSPTQGGGSFMQFTTENLNEEQVVMMMDAIRIAFLDNQSNLLGIAKLNTSNNYVDGNSIAAPLYLYDHNVSLDGSISVGERLDKNNKILSLQRNNATVITVVVWLDGDHVDNSSAAVSANSMSGMLNLQFSSSTRLVPPSGVIQPTE